jgi:citrate lyase subunit beta / citryl-CoA lyase
LLPVVHPLFDEVLHTVLRGARSGAHPPAYLMCPKPRSVGDVQQAVARIDAALAANGTAPVPVHVLIETHGALRDVWAIAAQPRVQSLSFGLMDFVSAHRGAIPASAMGAAGQFDHPLVVRAKLEIAAACHAHGKVPSHCVVTEFKDTAALRAAVEMASQLLGYTRMWSIHPAQVRTIVDAFAPAASEVDEAVQIIAAAQAAHWAPIRQGDTLHDRASYRYYWQLLQRARRTAFAGGPQLPAAALAAWFSAPDTAAG